MTNGIEHNTFVGFRSPNPKFFLSMGLIQFLGLDINDPQSNSGIKSRIIYLVNVDNPVEMD